MTVTGTVDVSIFIFYFLFLFLFLFLFFIFSRRIQFACGPAHAGEPVDGAADVAVNAVT
jgi:hypothetical protein